jgi:uncharacterized protein (DUF488 family)
MPWLATIGYEGAGFDDFLATLRQAGVVTLVDVRQPPASRRAGYSKSRLREAVEGMRIRYVHLEEYIAREVTHIPDAWITGRNGTRRTEIGIVDYEINFNRHLYVYKPPRPLREIEADTRTLEIAMLREAASGRSTDRPKPASRGQVRHRLLSAGIQVGNQAGRRTGH